MHGEGQGSIPWQSTNFMARSETMWFRRYDKRGWGWVITYSGERQRWRVAADCKSPVLYLVGSNPTSPTKVRHGIRYQDAEVCVRMESLISPVPIAEIFQCERLAGCKELMGRSPA